VEWLKFSGGAAMNEAILSGSLEVASGGVGPLVTISDRTKGRFDVKGISAINSMPLYLTSNNPNVKTIKDFTDKDRIALPAVRVSIQAVTLQIAAEKEFGKGNHTKLDSLTVSMPHPTATAALLSGKTEVTAHLSSPPFQYQQLQQKSIHRVLSSYDVMGGKTTFNSLWARSSFRAENPKTNKALVDAHTEAMGWIRGNHEKAADVYIKQSKSARSRLHPQHDQGPGDRVHDRPPQYDGLRFVHAPHRLGQEQPGVLEGLLLRGNPRRGRELSECSILKSRLRQAPSPPPRRFWRSTGSRCSTRPRNILSPPRIASASRFIRPIASSF
jgi:ABC-type nitrate/sulfonate/bicarbonate transport system substrate-binding protein